MLNQRIQQLSLIALVSFIFPLFCLDHGLILACAALFGLKQLLGTLLLGMIDLVQVYSSKCRHRKLLRQLTCIRLLEHLKGLLAGEILTDLETGLRLRVLILFAPLRCLHDRGHGDCIRLRVRFIAQICGGCSF